MKRSLTLICLICLCSFAANAQSNSTSKFKENVQQLAVDLNANQPAIQLIKFAKTLIGVPYRYASSNPSRGFDCSGFVNYVFNSVGLKVPRSSKEFPKAGTPVALEKAKVGDVLIFTGSNPRIRTIGHVGIVYSVDGDNIKFIHSSSGRAKGVTISELDGHYKQRFIKAVNII